MVLSANMQSFCMCLKLSYYQPKIGSYNCKMFYVSLMIASSSLINSVGKLDIHMQKNEARPLSYTTHKNQLKMDLRLE